MEIQTSNEIHNLNKIYESDFCSFTGNWIWKAVLCLIESPDFNPSPKWISQRLNISIENAVEAVEGLERLGYISKSNNNYVTNNSDLHISYKEAPKKVILQNTAELMQQTISKITLNDKYMIKFMLGNDTLISEFCPRFSALYSEMENKAKELKLTDVIVSQISFSVLTREESGAL